MPSCSCPPLNVGGHVGAVQQNDHDHVRGSKQQQGETFSYLFPPLQEVKLEQTFGDET